MDETLFSSALSNTHNLPEISVKDLSTRVKDVLETSIGRIRVRGEITNASRAGKAGHVYFSLKDTTDKGSATIASVAWKGVLSRLKAQPEDGLEVIVTGALTTFGSQSKYQLVVEQIEMAGIGALMQQLEARRKKLAEEGLFNPSRRRPLPLYPEVIGVITSPTGAVIQDILHRLEDRWPCRVIVWPVTVQGATAADEVTQAIEGFNALPVHSDNVFDMPRPDVLIVARGGGSFEDLLPFSEEKVIRAVANSAIPIISAIGHETDRPLMDEAADERAPTPTAAAEKATPVLRELLTKVEQSGGTLTHALTRLLNEKENHLLRYRLPDIQTWVEKQQSAFQLKSIALDHSFQAHLKIASDRLQNSHHALHPRLLDNLMQQQVQLLKHTKARLETAFQQSVTAQYQRHQDRLKQNQDRLNRIVDSIMQKKEQQLKDGVRLLETLSHKATLARGFALIYDENGKVVQKGNAVEQGQRLSVTFQDCQVGVQVLDQGKAVDISNPVAKTAKKNTVKKKLVVSTPIIKQGELF